MHGVIDINILKYRSVIFTFFSRIKAGVNFWHIEQQLRSHGVHSFLTMQRRYCLDTKHWQDLFRSDKIHTHSEEFPDINIFLNVHHPIPSDTYLRDIFLDHFYSEVIAYRESFNSLSGTVLSCDHTFKVSVNIGFMNPVTKTWTKQYDSLFIILNEFGQVLGHQLVKSTSFSNIESLLEDVKDAISDNVSIVMLDNCCTWKKK